MLDTAARLCEAYLPIGFASALAGRKTTENPGATRGFLFAPPTQLTAPLPSPSLRATRGMTLASPNDSRGGLSPTRRAARGMMLARPPDRISTGWRERQHGAAGFELGRSGFENDGLDSIPAAAGTFRGARFDACRSSFLNKRPEFDSDRGGCWRKLTEDACRRRIAEMVEEIEDQAAGIREPTGRPASGAGGRCHPDEVTATSLGLPRST